MNMKDLIAIQRLIRRIVFTIHVVRLDILGLEIQRLFYLFNVYLKKKELIPIIFWFAFVFGVQKIGLFEGRNLLFCQ